MFRHLARQVRSLFQSSRAEQQLDAELQYHLDMLVEQQVRLGLSPGQARREALRLFGPVEGIKDDVRDAWASRLWQILVQDLRYGARNLGRNPGFAAAVALTMALGIGANTAIFSVVNGVLLRDLPFANSSRLVVLRQGEGDTRATNMGFSVKEIEDYRQARAFSDVVEFHSMSFILLGGDEPQRVTAGVVSANYFDVLGVRPLAGRTFAPSDDAPGAPAVLVLGYQYWQRAFGGDPAIVGRVFRMNDKPHTVVGVLPPVPQYPLPVDVYMPTAACPFRSNPRTVENRQARMLSAFARVRDEVRLTKAQADVEIASAQMARTHPEGGYPAANFHATITPLKDDLTRDFRAKLFILLGTAAFVLLIVCASVANLALSRLVRREHELTVRAALGANRARIIRQLLTESTLLALGGGVLGLILAAVSLPILIAFVGRYTPRAADIGLDLNVLLFTFAISVVTGVVFGTIPAVQTGADASAILREHGRTTHGRQSLRHALIVAQVAVSFMLLIAAGLTLRSFWKLEGVNPGFRPENIVTFRASMAFDRFPLTTPDNQRLERMTEYWRAFEQRLRALPGVNSVGGGGTFPLNAEGSPTLLLKLEREGHPLPPGAAVPQFTYLAATPDYFRALGQPLKAGRAFTARDTWASPPVVIVNESAARHVWGSDDPVGTRIRQIGGRDYATVVGVVGDVRRKLDQSPVDEVYVPMTQNPSFGTIWVVHTTLPIDAITRDIKTAARGHDETMPVDSFSTLENMRVITLTPWRVTAALLGGFALLALFITAAGLTGVIAFSVNQRAQEFGVRMALGATRGTVVRMVLRQGISLVAVGLALGIAGALALTRLITSLLFGVQPDDLATYGAVALVLLAVAVVACIEPARRAASVDPNVALRTS